MVVASEQWTRMDRQPALLEVRANSIVVERRQRFQYLQLKPGFHYPSWRVTGFHYPCWRVMETGHPSTWAVNSGRQLG